MRARAARVAGSMAAGEATTVGFSEDASARIDCGSGAYPRAKRGASRAVSHTARIDVD